MRPKPLNWMLLMGGVFSANVHAQVCNEHALFSMRHIVAGGGLSGRALAVGDLDNDGDKDLVIKAAENGGVFLNLQADGYVRAGDPPPVLSSSTGHLVDLDGDGFLDALSGLFFARGNGDGTFSGGQVPLQSGYGHSTSCDVDGDGDNDIVVSSDNGTSLLINDGFGNFGDPLIIAAADSSYRIFDANLNADQTPDFVRYSYGGTEISCLVSDGPMSWSERVFTVGGSVETVRASELSGDGAIDLVIVDRFQSKVSLWHGDGAGEFVDSSFALSFGPARPWDVAFGDYDSDGKSDILVNRAHTAMAAILLAGDDYTYQDVRHIPASIYWQGGGGVSSEDLDNDGQSDVLIQLAFSVAAYKLSPGDPLPELEYLEWGEEALPPLPDAHDFDQDGRPEFMFSDPGGDGLLDNELVIVRIGEGLSADSFARIPLRGSYGAIRVTDVGGSPLPDIVSLAPGRDGPSLRVQLGDPGLEFDRAVTLAGARGSKVGVVDLNADGHKDIVMVDRFIRCWLGPIGTGFVRLPVDSSIGANTGGEDFVLADFDEDGVVDIVVRKGNSTFPGSLQIQFGLGNGGFGEPEGLAFAGPIVAGDFNGDGHQDVLASDLFLQGDGSGQFESVEGQFQVDFDTQVLDLNHDSIDDALTSTLGVTVGSADALSNAFIDFQGVDYASPFVTGDFDLDGDIDVIVFNRFNEPGHKFEYGYLFNSGRCTPLCLSDFAPPAGVLDFDDVLAFLVAFGASEPAADLSEPFGVIDFDDVLAFLVSFGSGCP